MFNFTDTLMYLNYYKKSLYLNCLKVFRRLDYTGRIENSNPLFRGYEGCYPVKKLLKTMNITNRDSILDIGCGKGLFLYYASKFEFGKIDGIEYSDTLVETAKRNVQILKDNRIHIYCYDAVDFKNYNQYNYFFINNPFSAEIMEKVIQALKDSYATKKRKIVVLYQFPFSIDTFTKHKFKILYKHFPNAILTFG